jgi:hypothetical protein
MKAGFKGALWGAVSAGVANGIGTAFSGAGTGAAAARALAHGLTRAAISKAQGGRYSEGFWSGFASSALGGTIGRAKTLGGQMTLAAIVGGTTSKLGGGKFANGAVSGAFVHMYNWTAHVSSSVSGGAVVGGTLEGGWVISHDSKQPWYKGWGLGTFTTGAVGGYANVDVSAELNVGFSWNDGISVMERTNVTAGGSGGPWVIDGGYEVSTGSGVQSPIYNVSIGVSTPTPVPFETHGYKTFTQVNRVWGN